MELEKIARDQISSYKNMEEYLKWITNTICEIHGPSCGGSLLHEVSSGIYIIDEKKVNNFCESHFSYFDKEPKEKITAELKSLFDTERSQSTYKYIDIKCGTGNVDNPITGGYFYFCSSADNADNGGKRTIFIGLAQLTKLPAPNHYFLKDYYEGNHDRVEKH
ncbi:1808_t:CDS:1 [Racocetra persica]|uniref:1808_t:CDS:1 n=1 Tax=Racocetra persica TaxID=160502 RepID=A0ACA9R523_9GLOM|nr:1808_t:CDS:1 [Racocetra persica]